MTDTIKTTHPVIANPQVTRHIMKAFNLRAAKKLGQNFLVDAGIVQGIVDAAGAGPDDNILEIGPGIGTLTQGLAESGAKVTAVELDKKLPAVLAHTLEGYDNVTIVPGDILKVNIPELMGNKPFKVAANLPYYITTPILMALLEQHLPISILVTMVQKEVALRMIAQPGSKIYGALSVAVQYYTRPHIAFDVPPKSFIPAPEVESTVIEIKLKQDRLPLINEEFFLKFNRNIFIQRRKTLYNNIKSAYPLSKEIIEDIIKKNNLPLTVRSEALNVEQIVKLSNDVYSTLNK